MPAKRSVLFEEGKKKNVIVDDIQPLRDLALNFDIDIEPYLREYLEDVSGQNDVNDNDEDEDEENYTDTATATTTTQQTFATAAIKLQTSAGIYDRKVEYLHKSTYEVLDELIQQLAAQQQQHQRGGSIVGRRVAIANTPCGRDVDVTAFRNYDREIEFLLLDDVLPVDTSTSRSSINLHEEDLDDDIHENVMDTTALDNTALSPNDDQRKNVTLLSLGGMMSTSRVNFDETFVIGRKSLEGTSPSVMTRMLMANLMGGGHGDNSSGGGGLGGGGGGSDRGGGNLRLLGGACDVGHDGVLLMPGTMATVFVNGIEREAAPRPDESIRIHPGGQSPRNSINNNEELNEFGALDQDYDYDNDGVGFEMYDDENRGDFEETTVDDATVDAGNRTQTEEAISKQKSKPKLVIDPWKCLDPHEPTKADLKPRPIRIGVSYVLPAGLDGPPSDEVNGSRTKRKDKGKKTTSSPKSVVEEPVDPLKDRPYIADLYYKSFMGDEEASKLLSKAGDFYKDEFAYIRKAHEKERDANKRRQRKLDDDVEDMAPKNGVDGVDKYFEEEEVGNNGEEYYDNGNGFDCGGDDDNDHSAGRPRSNVDFDAVFPSFAGRGGYEDDDDDYDRRRDYDADDISLGKPKTFEELCRAHLRKFAKSAEIYAAETQLTKRVGKWQEGLAPILEAQEDRPEFDIHETGRQILEKMELSINAKKRTSSGEMKLASSNIVNFSTIVPKDCEEYELCRLFLSTLMLCNTRNIAVKKSEDGEHVESIESFDIELLNSEFLTPMDVSFIDPSASHVLRKEIAATSNLGMIDENDGTVADD